MRWKTTLKFPSKAAKISLLLITATATGTATVDSFPLFDSSSRAITAFSDDFRAPFFAFRRSSYTFFTIASTIFDYKYSIYGLAKGSDEYRHTISEVHLRSAKRILKLCEDNKGFYVKAGQFASSLRQLPKEYTMTLSVLQDKAVPCDFNLIKEVICRNLSSEITDMFLFFDEQPLAAASIAQVHRGVLKSGEEVAVKVQYPGLERLMELDITIMSFVSHVAAWFFSWLLAKQIILLFIQDLTTSQVAQALVEVFADMVFIHGFVHGDPHPGNILVSPSGQNDFTLVLLDHGMYKELDEGFTRNYCRLWKALILRDMDELLHTGESLGIGSYAIYLPIIFTGRTINSKAGLGREISNEERNIVKQELKALTMDDISSFMESLPAAFLTILRTDGILRSILSKLGTTQSVRILTYARSAIHGLSPIEEYEHGVLGLLSWIEDIKQILTKSLKRLLATARNLYLPHANH
uniref:ABC1 atypical kinase-like domain-containing protein n=1 Tax=Chenopodium quinoa TaxID=63459 RepID=A0A803LSP2_CHEQI